MFLFLTHEGDAICGIQVWARKQVSFLQYSSNSGCEADTDLLSSRGKAAVTGNTQFCVHKMVGRLAFAVGKQILKYVAAETTFAGSGKMIAHSSEANKQMKHLP